MKTTGRCPSLAISRGNAPQTSAIPPDLANGTTSLLATRISNELFLGSTPGFGKLGAIYPASNIGSGSAANQPLSYPDHYSDHNGHSGNGLAPVRQVTHRLNPHMCKHCTYSYRGRMNFRDASGNSYTDAADLDELHMQTR